MSNLLYFFEIKLEISRGMFNSRIVASLHCSAHDATYSRQVDVEMLSNLPMTIGADSVSSHNSSISSSMTGSNVCKSGGRWSALRLGKVQCVTLNFRLNAGRA